MLVIAHRGACGYRPEHTLESYRLAAEMGADYLEPDVVATRDGALVARHENEIGGTTDVADRPEFADRRTTRDIDGAPVTGWFTEDFTLAELKTLRAKERIPHLRPQNAAFDGRFEIPTLEEILDLRARLEASLGRTIGVYPETKHPTYFRSIGLPLEEPLGRALADAGLDRRDAPVYVQSFETGNLRELASMVRVPLVQLLGAPGRRPFGDGRTYADLATREGLADIAGYAAAVGPAKEHVDERFVAGARAAGLQVHPFTFRRENAFLPAELRSSEDPSAVGDLATEIERYVELGVDAVFTDNPDVAATTRARVRRSGPATG